MKHKHNIPVDYRPIGADRKGTATLRQHQDEVAQFEREVEKAAQDGMVPIFSDGKPHDIGFGSFVDFDDPVEQRRRRESMSCGGLRDSILMGGSSTIFDYSQQKFADVPEPATEGLGYAIWGPGNCLPNAIYNASAALPYTASALDYLDRTFFGLGAEIVYTVSRMSGGTVTHEEIPYIDAEVYLKDRRLQLITKVEERKAQLSGQGDTVPSASAEDSLAAGLQQALGLPVPADSDPILREYEAQLDQANAELESYSISRARLEAMMSSNNMSFFLKRWIADTVRFGICFPVIKLSATKAGKWTPTIDSFEMRDASVMRLEQRNPDHAFKIDHVYYSEVWRDGCSLELSSYDYVHYPCINPEHPLTDLRVLVNKHHRTKVGDRPYEVCYPCYQPTPTKPYYPQLPWWSIFPSQVYQYASTMIYDKAMARKNSTMWGKILFINTAYLAQIFAQAGEQGKTKEGQAAIRKGIYDSVENFLRRRDNNGKLLVMDSYPSADEKQMIDSVRIVDVPNNSDVRASASEVGEMASLVSYSLGVNMDLVGSRPFASSSTSNTAQRSLHLLKNGQLSPDRVTFTDFFNNFVFQFNDIDRHFRIRLLYPTLTTLDNSKTGIVEQSD